MRPGADDAGAAAPREEGDGPGWMLLPRWGCRLLGEPCWHGRTEWLLDFGWPRATAPAGGVAALRLAQVEPALLQSIEVRACGQLRFGLDICEGRRGQLATAGELLRAMAAAQGRHGLHIDAADLGAVVLSPHLSLRLRVWDATAPATQVWVLIADSVRQPLPRDPALALAAARLPAQSRPVA